MTRLRAALVLLLALSGALLGAAPAQAARTLTIELTANGPKPASLTVNAGDTVDFLNADPTFVHGAKSTSANWTFDTGPLPPMARATAGTLTKAGTYTYGSTNDLEQFRGAVVVPAASASPAPSPSPSRSSAEPSPSPTSSASSTAPASAASPGPSAAGGAGVVSPPLLSAGQLPPAAPLPGAPAPAVAPALPGAEGEQSASPAPGALAAPGRLAQPSAARRYGLPAALAAVAAVGVASLLLRLLLAHPAARHRRRSGQGTAALPVR